VLQMEGRGREQGEVADVVVVQTGDDHVLHGLRLYAEAREPFLRRRDRRAAAARADRGVEAGVDDEGPRARAREPHEVVEVAARLVRVAADEVLARVAAREGRVPDREYFVDVRVVQT